MPCFGQDLEEALERAETAAASEPPEVCPLPKLLKVWRGEAVVDPDDESLIISAACLCSLLTSCGCSGRCPCPIKDAWALLDDDCARRLSRLRGRDPIAWASAALDADTDADVFPCSTPLRNRLRGGY